MIYCVFKKYKVAILGGEKAPAGVCTPILDFERTVYMSWGHKDRDFVSSRHENQDSCFQKIKSSYFEKIITGTPILYFWSIEIPYRAHFWCRNSLVGWSSDSGCQGTGFDSRLVQVTFWSLFGHVGVTFSHFFGHVGMCLGSVFGHVRMGLGGFWEKVVKMSENVEK